MSVSEKYVILFHMKYYKRDQAQLFIFEFVYLNRSLSRASESNNLLWHHSNKNDRNESKVSRVLQIDTLPDLLESFTEIFETANSIQGLFDAFLEFLSNLTGGDFSVFDVVTPFPTISTSPSSIPTIKSPISSFGPSKSLEPTSFSFITQTMSPTKSLSVISTSSPVNNNESSEPNMTDNPMTIQSAKPTKEPTKQPTSRPTAQPSRLNSSPNNLPFNNQENLKPNNCSSNAPLKIIVTINTIIALIFLT